MSLLDILKLLGSLGLFLFGLRIMGEGLQKIAGNRLRAVLRGLTKNRINGIFSGFLITSAIQSSSATTVLVVSFANAGLSDESKGLVQLFAELDDGRLAVILIIVHDPADVVPGSMPIDLVNVAAIMTFYDPETDTSSGGGLILNGNLTFTSAETVTGAPIVGSMTGEVFEF